MSSIFSDPFFRRGSTLLSGEKIEVDNSGNPIAGTEVVGQVKAFQDVNPVGAGERYSNRLVYCIAVRYKGATVADASTVAGQLYTLNAGLTDIQNKTASADVDAGKQFGVLDDYLTGELRTDDIVWLVVKGPAKLTSSGAITAGSMVGNLDATAGTVATQSGTTSDAIGQAIAAAASNKVRVNLKCDFI